MLIWFDIELSLLYKIMSLHKFYCIINIKNISNGFWRWIETRQSKVNLIPSMKKNTWMELHFMLLNLQILRNPNRRKKCCYVSLIEDAWNKKKWKIDIHDAIFMTHWIFLIIFYPLYVNINNILFSKIIFKEVWMTGNKIHLKVS